MYLQHHPVFGGRYSDDPDLATVSPIAWCKSSRSSGNGQCAEVATSPTTVLIRDSKQASTPDHPNLTVDRDTWAGFLATL